MSKLFFLDNETQVAETKDRLLSRQAGEAPRRAPGLSRRAPMDGGGRGGRLQYYRRALGSSGTTTTTSPLSTSAASLASHGLWRASEAMAVSFMKCWTWHCHESITSNASSNYRIISGVRRGVMKVLVVCRRVGDLMWCWFCGAHWMAYT